MSKTKNKKQRISDEERYEEINKAYKSSLSMCARCVFIWLILAVLLVFVFIGNSAALLAFIIPALAVSIFIFVDSMQKYKNAKIDKLDLEKKLEEKRIAEEKKKAKRQQKAAEQNQDTVKPEATPKPKEPENVLKGHYSFFSAKGKNADLITKTNEIKGIKLDIKNNYIGVENLGAFKIRHIFDPKTNTTLVKEQEIVIDENGEKKTEIFPETKNEFTYDNDVLTIIRPSGDVIIYKRIVKDKPEPEKPDNKSNSVVSGLIGLTAVVIYDIFLDND